MSAHPVLMAVIRSALTQMVPTIVDAKLVISLKETSNHVKVSGRLPYQNHQSPYANCRY